MGREPWAAELRVLLNLNAVAGHDFIHGELLAGNSGGKRDLSSYGGMQQAPVITHNEVVAFMQARRLYGRGAGWIDMHLLASALAGRMQLWTADHSLAALAAELGIAYKLGSRGLYLLPK